MFKTCKYCEEMYNTEQGHKCSKQPKPWKNMKIRPKILIEPKKPAGFKEWLEEHAPHVKKLK